MAENRESIILDIRTRTSGVRSAKELVDELTNALARLKKAQESAAKPRSFEPLIRQVSALLNSLVKLSKSGKEASAEFASAAERVLAAVSELVSETEKAEEATRRQAKASDEATKAAARQAEAKGRVAGATSKLSEALRKEISELRRMADATDRSVESERRLGEVILKTLDRVARAKRALGEVPTGLRDLVGQLQSRFRARELGKVRTQTILSREEFTEAVKLVTLINQQLDALAKRLATTTRATRESAEAKKQEAKASERAARAATEEAEATSTASEQARRAAISHRQLSRASAEAFRAFTVAGKALDLYEAKQIAADKATKAFISELVALERAAVEVGGKELARFDDLMNRVAGSTERVPRSIARVTKALADFAKVRREAGESSALETQISRLNERFDSLKISALEDKLSRMRAAFREAFAGATADIRRIAKDIVQVPGMLAAGLTMRDPPRSFEVFRKALARTTTSVDEFGAAMTEVGRIVGRAERFIVPMSKAVNTLRANYDRFVRVLADKEKIDIAAILRGDTNALNEFLNAVERGIKTGELAVPQFLKPDVIERKLFGGKGVFVGRQLAAASIATFGFEAIAGRPEQIAQLRQTLGIMFAQVIADIGRNLAQLGQHQKLLAEGTKEVARQEAVVESLRRRVAKATGQEREALEAELEKEEDELAVRHRQRREIVKAAEDITELNAKLIAFRNQIIALIGIFGGLRGTFSFGGQRFLLSSALAPQAFDRSLFLAAVKSGQIRVERTPISFRRPPIPPDRVSDLEFALERLQQRITSPSVRFGRPQPKPDEAFIMVSKLRTITPEVLRGVTRFNKVLVDVSRETEKARIALEKFKSMELAVAEVSREAAEAFVGRAFPLGPRPAEFSQTRLQEDVHEIIRRRAAPFLSGEPGFTPQRVFNQIFRDVKKLFFRTPDVQTLVASIRSRILELQKTAVESGSPSLRAQTREQIQALKNQFARSMSFILEQLANRVISTLQTIDVGKGESLAATKAITRNFRDLSTSLERVSKELAEVDKDATAIVKEVNTIDEEADDVAVGFGKVARSLARANVSINDLAGTMEIVTRRQEAAGRTAGLAATTTLLEAGANKLLAIGRVRDILREEGAPTGVSEEFADEVSTRFTRRLNQVSDALVDTPRLEKQLNETVARSARAHARAARAAAELERALQQEKIVVVQATNATKRSSPLIKNIPFTFHKAIIQFTRIAEEASAKAARIGAIPVSRIIAPPPVPPKATVPLTPGFHPPILKQAADEQRRIMDLAKRTVEIQERSKQLPVLKQAREQLPVLKQAADEQRRIMNLARRTVEIQERSKQLPILKQAADEQRRIMNLAKRTVEIQERSKRLPAVPTARRVAETVVRAAEAMKETTKATTEAVKQVSRVAEATRTSAKTTSDTANQMSRVAKAADQAARATGRLESEAGRAERQLEGAARAAGEIGGGLLGGGRRLLLGGGVPEDLGRTPKFQVEAFGFIREAETVQEVIKAVQELRQVLGTTAEGFTPLIRRNVEAGTTLADVEKAAKELAGVLADLRKQGLEQVNLELEKTPASASDVARVMKAFDEAAKEAGVSVTALSRDLTKLGTSLKAAFQARLPGAEPGIVIRGERLKQLINQVQQTGREFLQASEEAKPFLDVVTTIGKQAGLADETIAVVTGEVTAFAKGLDAGAIAAEKFTKSLGQLNQVRNQVGQFAEQMLRAGTSTTVLVQRIDALSENAIVSADVAKVLKTEVAAVQNRWTDFTAQLERGRAVLAASMDQLNQVRNQVGQFAEQTVRAGGSVDVLVQRIDALSKNAVISSDVAEILKTEVTNVQTRWTAFTAQLERGRAVLVEQNQLMTTLAESLGRLGVTAVELGRDVGTVVPAMRGLIDVTAIGEKEFANIQAQLAETEARLKALPESTRSAVSIVREFASIQEQVRRLAQDMLNANENVNLMGEALKRLAKFGLEQTGAELKFTDEQIQLLVDGIRRAEREFSATKGIDLFRQQLFDLIQVARQARVTLAEGGGITLSRQGVRELVSTVAGSARAFLGTAEDIQPLLNSLKAMAREAGFTERTIAELAIQLETMANVARANAGSIDPIKTAFERLGSAGQTLRTLKQSIVESGGDVSVLVKKVEELGKSTGLSGDLIKILKAELEDVGSAADASSQNLDKFSKRLTEAFAPLKQLLGRVQQTGLEFLRTGEEAKPFLDVVTTIGKQAGLTDETIALITSEVADLAEGLDAGAIAAEKFTKSLDQLNQVRNQVGQFAEQTLRAGGNVDVLAQRIDALSKNAIISSDVAGILKAEVAGVRAQWTDFTAQLERGRAVLVEQNQLMTTLAESFGRLGATAVELGRDVGTVVPAMRGLIDVTAIGEKEFADIQARLAETEARLKALPQATRDAVSIVREFASIQEQVRRLARDMLNANENVRLMETVLSNLAKIGLKQAGAELKLTDEQVRLLVDGIRQAEREFGATKGIDLFRQQLFDLIQVARQARAAIAESGDIVLSRQGVRELASTVAGSARAFLGTAEDIQPLLSVLKTMAQDASFAERTIAELVVGISTLADVARVNARSIDPIKTAFERLGSAGQTLRTLKQSVVASGGDVSVLAEKVQELGKSTGLSDDLIKILKAELEDVGKAAGTSSQNLDKFNKRLIEMFAAIKQLAVIKGTEFAALGGVTEQELQRLTQAGVRLVQPIISEFAGGTIGGNVRDLFLTRIQNRIRQFAEDAKLSSKATEELIKRVTEFAELSREVGEAAIAFGRTSERITASDAAAQNATRSMGALVTRLQEFRDTGEALSRPVAAFIRLSERINELRSRFVGFARSIKDAGGDMDRLGVIVEKLAQSVGLDAVELDHLKQVLGDLKTEQTPVTHAFERLLGVLDRSQSDIRTFATAVGEVQESTSRFATTIQFLGRTMSVMNKDVQDQAVVANALADMFENVGSAFELAAKAGQDLRPTITLLTEGVPNVNALFNQFAVTLERARSKGIDQFNTELKILNASSKETTEVVSQLIDKLRQADEAKQVKFTFDTSQVAQGTLRIGVLAQAFTDARGEVAATTSVIARLAKTLIEINPNTELLIKSIQRLGPRMRLSSQLIKQLIERIKQYSSETGVAEQRLNQFIRTLRRQAEAQRSLVSGEGGLEILSSRLNQLQSAVFSMLIGFFTFRQGFERLREQFRAGVEEISKFQTILLEMQTLLSARLPRFMPVVQRIVLAQQASRQIVRELELVSARTLGTLDQVIQTFNALVRSGVDNISQAQRLAGTLTTVISLLTRGQQASIQLNQEIRALLQGTGRREASQLRMFIEDVLGLTQTQVRLLLDQGKLVETLQRRLQIVLALEKDFANALVGLETTFNTIVARFRRTAFEDIVEAIQDVLTEVRSQLLGTDVFEQIGAAARRAFDPIARVIRNLGDNLLATFTNVRVLNSIERLSESLLRGREETLAFIAALGAFGSIVGTISIGLGSMVAGIATIVARLGALEKTVLGVGAALSILLARSVAVRDPLLSLSDVLNTVAVVGKVVIDNGFIIAALFASLSSRAAKMTAVMSGLAAVTGNYTQAVLAGILALASLSFNFNSVSLGVLHLRKRIGDLIIGLASVFTFIGRLPGKLVDVARGFRQVARAQTAATAATTATAASATGFVGVLKRLGSALKAATAAIWAYVSASVAMGLATGVVVGVITTILVLIGISLVKALTRSKRAAEENAERFAELTGQLRSLNAALNETARSDIAQGRNPMESLTNLVVLDRMRAVISRLGAMKGEFQTIDEFLKTQMTSSMDKLKRDFLDVNEAVEKLTQSIQVVNENGEIRVRIRVAEQDESGLSRLLRRFGIFIGTGGLGGAPLAPTTAAVKTNVAMTVSNIVIDENATASLERQVQELEKQFTVVLKSVIAVADRTGDVGVVKTLIDDFEKLKDRVAPALRAEIESMASALRQAIVLIENGKPAARVLTDILSGLKDAFSRIRQELVLFNDELANLVTSATLTQRLIDLQRQLARAGKQIPEFAETVERLKTGLVERIEGRDVQQAISRALANTTEFIERLRTLEIKEDDIVAEINKITASLEKLGVRQDALNQARSKAAQNTAKLTEQQSEEVRKLNSRLATLKDQLVTTRNNIEETTKEAQRALTTITTLLLFPREERRGGGFGFQRLNDFERIIRRVNRLMLDVKALTQPEKVLPKSMFSRLFGRVITREEVTEARRLETLLRSAKTAIEQINALSIRLHGKPFDFTTLFGKEAVPKTIEQLEKANALLRELRSQARRRIEIPLESLFFADRFRERIVRAEVAIRDRLAKFREELALQSDALFQERIARIITDTRNALARIQAFIEEANAGFFRSTAERNRVILETIVSEQEASRRAFSELVAEEERLRAVRMQDELTVQRIRDTVRAERIRREREIAQSILTTNERLTQGLISLELRLREARAKTRLERRESILELAKDVNLLIDRLERLRANDPEELALIQLEAMRRTVQEQIDAIVNATEQVAKANARLLTSRRITAEEIKAIETEVMIKVRDLDLELTKERIRNLELLKTKTEFFAERIGDRLLEHLARAKGVTDIVADAFANFARSMEGAFGTAIDKIAAKFGFLRDFVAQTLRDIVGLLTRELIIKPFFRSLIEAVEKLKRSAQSATKQVGGAKGVFRKAIDAILAKLGIKQAGPTAIQATQLQVLIAQARAQRTFHFKNINLLSDIRDSNDRIVDLLEAILEALHQPLPIPKRGINITDKIIDAVIKKIVLFPPQLPGPGLLNLILQAFPKDQPAPLPPGGGTATAGAAQAQQGGGGFLGKLFGIIGRGLRAVLRRVFGSGRDNIGAGFGRLAGGLLGTALGRGTGLGQFAGFVGGSILGGLFGGAILEAIKGKGLAALTGLLGGASLAFLGIGAGLLAFGAIFSRFKRRAREKQIASQTVNELFKQLRGILLAVQIDRMSGDEAIAKAKELFNQWVEFIRNNLTDKTVIRQSISSQSKFFGEFLEHLKREAELQRDRKRVLSRAVPQFESGGIVPGRDTGRDSVLALLRPGEFVIRKEAVELIGKDVLERINRAPGQRTAPAELSARLQRLNIPGFQGGGEVPRLPNLQNLLPLLLLLLQILGGRLPEDIRKLLEQLLRSGGDLQGLIRALLVGFVSNRPFFQNLPEAAQEAILNTIATATSLADIKQLLASDVILPLIVSGILRKLGFENAPIAELILTAGLRGGLTGGAVGAVQSLLNPALLGQILSIIIGRRLGERNPRFARFLIELIKNVFQEGQFNLEPLIGALLTFLVRRFAPNAPIEAILPLLLQLIEGAGFPLVIPFPPEGLLDRVRQIFSNLRERLFGGGETEGGGPLAWLRERLAGLRERLAGLRERLFGEGGIPRAALLALPLLLLLARRFFGGGAGAGAEAALLGGVGGILGNVAFGPVLLMLLLTILARRFGLADILGRLGERFRRGDMTGADEARREALRRVRERLLGRFAPEFVGPGGPLASERERLIGRFGGLTGGPEPPFGGRGPLAVIRERLQNLRERFLGGGGEREGPRFPLGLGLLGLLAALFLFRAVRGGGGGGPFGGLFAGLFGGGGGGGGGLTPVGEQPTPTLPLKLLKKFGFPVPAPGPRSPDFTLTQLPGDQPPQTIQAFQTPPIGTVIGLGGFGPTGRGLGIPLGTTGGTSTGSGFVRPRRRRSEPPIIIHAVLVLDEAGVPRIMQKGSGEIVKIVKTAVIDNEVQF